MYVTVPVLRTKYLDFTGLNNIVAYHTASLQALRIHPTCMLATVVTVDNKTPIECQTYFSVCLGAS